MFLTCHIESRGGLLSHADHEFRYNCIAAACNHDLIACRFGEGLDPQVLDMADKAVATCDLFMSIGTSSVVYPAAGFVKKVVSTWSCSFQSPPSFDPWCPLPLISPCLASIGTTLALPLCAQCVCAMMLHVHVHVARSQLHWSVTPADRNILGSCGTYALHALMTVAA